MAYLTAALVRERQPTLSDPTAYPDDTIDDLVAEFEELAEEYRGIAFIPRTVTETIVRPTREIVLARSPVRSITSVTVDGTAGVVADLGTDLSIGAVWGGGWGCESTVVFVYSHGLDSPLRPILRGCAEYVRACATADRSGTSRDVISQRDVDAGVVTRYSTPDWDNGRPTGFLEVDRLLNSVRDHRLPGLV